MKASLHVAASIPLGILIASVVVLLLWVWRADRYSPKPSRGGYPLPQSSGNLSLSEIEPNLWNESFFADVDELAAISANAPRHVRRIHFHIISIGDSLVSGSSFERTDKYPYTPRLADVLSSLVSEHVKLGKAPWKGSIFDSELRVTSTSETHGFPATVSKKILYAARTRFASKRQPGNSSRVPVATRALEASTTSSPPPEQIHNVAPKKSKKRGTGPRGYKFIEQTDDASGQQEDTLGDQQLTDDNSSAFSGDAVEKVLVDGTVDILVVGCTVLAGINDATLGIPWWWVRKNIQALHNVCRKRATDAALSMNRSTDRSNFLAIVLSIPLRIIPPYYYLIDGRLAQTRRVAKRNLDPTNLCEFWFRSPRRKQNLHFIVDAMTSGALNSTYPSRPLEEYAGSPRAPHDLSWCRRSTWCHGVPAKATAASNAPLDIGSAVKPCVVFNSPSSGANRTICYFSRGIVPIDRLFVLPDRLVTSAIWRSQLQLWSDCIHPSPLGYEKIAQSVAAAVTTDVELVMSLLSRHSRENQ